MIDCSRKILVVDDFDLGREMLVSSFEGLGFDVQEATNGIEALKKAIIERFDVIIMDIDMPRMNGYEATRNLRSNGNDSIIVGFSGGGANNMESDCIKSGMDGFFSKPSGIRDLLNFVGNHCRSL